MGTPREIEPWQVVDSTWILRSGFMNIRRDRCRTADGSRSRDLDEGEEIEVQAVPLDRAADYLEDVSSLLALHLARPHLR
jgi:hypothetical protein